MTEENEPEQPETEQGAPDEAYEQTLDGFLRRIAALEQRIAELEQQLQAAQGGTPI